MKNTLLQMLESGVTLVSKNKQVKIITFISLLLLITTQSFSQTIAGTGTGTSTCGNCTPTGWVDSGGTPDISNRTNTGGQGSVGGGATWVNTLPLPPTGDLTWISIRDIGNNPGVLAGSEESVSTTMGGLVAGKVYRLNIYTLTSLSNADGNNPASTYYSGSYMDEFEFEVEGNGRQPIRNITREVWGTKSVIFIGDPTSGNMDLTFYPKTDATIVGAPFPGLESVQIAIELNDLEELDSDGDGIPDSDDVDDDNDGILDTVESTVGGIIYDPLGDEDGDKLPNYLDVRDDGTGDGSNTSYTDVNNDGIADIFDFDLDGIPNHLDLDADNDGIPDNIEAQTTNGYIAPSGAVGAGFTDADGDGLDDNYDPVVSGGTAGTAITPVNSDSATVTDNPDYLDLDSDEDGVSDTVEANLILSGTVGNNGLDNTYDNGDDYTDVNGVFDDTQTDNFPDDGANANLGLPNDVNWRDVSVTGFLDTDGDGIANNVDIDDDNDGIPDTTEQGLLCPGSITYEFYDGAFSPSVDNIPTTGALATGTVTNFDVNALQASLDPGDADTYGIRYTGYINITTAETYTFYTTSDDGSKLFIDGTEVVTNDNDHGPVEQSGTIALTPGIYPFSVLFYENAIGSELSVSYSSSSITKTTIPFASFYCDKDLTLNTDPDGDGIPNYLDLDSDNDGIPDNIEGQATGSYIAPTGSVGANGLYNVYENNDTTSATSFSVENTDGDEFPDYIDTDSDNDGTSDNAEADLVLSGTVGINGLDNLLDNGDSYADVNGSADNTPFGEYPDNPSGGEIDWRDETSIFIDTDNDGVPNSVDLDDDNDGILDTDEQDLVCPSVSFVNLSQTFTNTDTATNGGTGSGSVTNLYPFSFTRATFNYSLVGTAAWVGGVNSANTGGVTGDYINVQPNNANIPGGNYAEYKVTFSNPVSNLSFKWGGLDNQDRINITANNNGSNVGVTITDINLGANLVVNSSQSITSNATAGNAPSNSVSISANAPITELTIIAGKADANTGSVTMQLYELTYCDNFLDTDGDGIPNHLDLDSDNDGIPDNIEAQTTQGYTAPDGIYDANGVDTAYTGGLVPEDTDADTFPDYIDTDADDDGLLDNTEAGLTLTGIYGNNGLDNAYDNGDNYLDVNGSFDTTQTDNFPDEDGDVLNAGDVDYRDDTFTIDNDGDNISDEVDLDDDNDGIVDLIEFGTCSSNNGILNWDNEYLEGDTVVTNGDDPITTNPSVTNANVTISLSRTSNVNSESNYRINDATTTNSSYNINQAASSNALSRHTFNFSAPVFGATFTIYDVNQDVATIATDKVQVIITKQDGTNYTLIPANYTVGATNTYLGTNTFQGTGLGASNVVINSIDEWITQIQIVYENEGIGSLADFQNIAIGNIAYCTPVDTDGDGVFDFRDLDADNDGIPDNIEAQSTQGYIPPTGNYSLFGIDLAYDTGITPENTDGDSEPDYLDLDSDNEGAFDIVESGSGLTDANTDGVADGVPADFGTNGLINSLDDGAGDTDGDGFGEGTGDNYKDVNGTFDDTQNDNFTDSDTDVNIGGDVDYRDDIIGVDSDDDGIINSIDIDDDNDGIPDTIESNGNDPDGDEDNDGIPNYRDNSDDGNGGPGGTTDYTDTNSDGIPDVFDFDNDGVPNHLDIDADNDGIPDNVEAQTTLGYVSPSGVDTDNDGLDDAYDTDCTPCGAITGVDLSVPNNHDTIDNPDYLDTDSDEDGIPDIEENGFTDNTVSGTDTDNDGLDDNFEGADVNDDYDVNDEINIPASDLPDTDSDVSTTGDVDYRDDTEDPITPGVLFNTLWLRADLDVTGGANVTLWEDQTASLDFTAAGGQEPDATANILNFNPTVTFTPANGDALTYTGNLNPRTMYIVYNDTSTTNWATPFTNDNAGGGTIGHGHSDDSQLYNATFTPANVVNGAEYVSGLTADFLTRPRPDNFELHSRVYLANDWNSSINYYIGRDRNITIPDRGINGSIAEIMLFSDAHSDAKRQQIESYLATKYGFTLDDTDNSGSIVEGDYVLADGATKVWDYTNNSTFHNDVAGIGRDDAMALNQKQSKSVNSDAIITIGLDAITASNATNLNTFTSNKNFLMWGNNNGVVNSISETELICAPEKTIGRAWKVVENGSVGTTQIAVNKATIDAALVTPNTVKVFKVADDASFTTNVQYMPVTSEVINSENVYTVDFDFNGIKYFTYSEINGIFWNGDMNAWVGGNSGVISGGPSTNAADRNKVMVIDAQTSLTHAVLTENVNVECVWIKENSKLMVSDDRYLEFDEDFILDGEMRLIGDGQLVQTHTGLSNVEGTGKLYRDQQAIVPSIYRYHYWSSPVRELNLNTYRVGQVMKDGNVPTSASSTITEIDWTGDGNIYDGATGTAGVTPIKIAPYWIYTYLNGTTQANYKQTFQTGPIKRGQGYTMKSTGAVPQNFTFVGTPNDGSITFDFSPNTTSMLGNPYPSALDATDFINTNIDKIDGTLYFWEHTGEDSFTPATSEGHNLTGYQGGYSQRNISMGIAANGVGTVDPLVFDWTTAVDNGTNISQTVDGVEVIVTRSSGTFELLPNILGVGGTIGNIIGNTPLTTSSYDVTFDFNGKVDLKSIYLFNNVVLPLTNPTVTITPNRGNSSVTQELSGVTGQEITLDWEDVTSFTITTDIPYNLVIDDLKFTKGNLPSLGDGTYRAPNRYIAVGQGFFVSSSETGGTVRFENSQRNYQGDVYASGGTYFFKSEKKEKAAKSISNEPLDLLPRLKLGFNYTVTGSSKAHRQIGISFRRTNTFGFDNGYDSEIYDLGNTDFYWNFPEYSDKNLIIAGVPAITKEMEIPLTVVIGANNPFEIQIDEIKNINKDVYLLDKLTNTYYTLSTTPMELDVPVGTYNDRFYITFTNQNALSTENVNPLSKEVNVYLDNSSKEIVIENSNLLEIKKVEVYNLLGQKVKTFKNLETATVNRLKTSKLPTMVYIINLETENGKLSKKVIIE